MMMKSKLGEPDTLSHVMPWNKQMQVYTSLMCRLQCSPIL